MGCDIYISDYKRTKMLQFPIIPSELPLLSSDAKNEEFETYWDRPYNFIEKPGLIQTSWDSWLPTNASKYYFCKSKVNAREIIDLIENAKTNAEPIILVITVNGGFYVNSTFSIEKFEYNVIKRGDYQYSFGVKEWREYTATISSTYTIGWEQDSTGWYYYIDTSGNYYKDSWQLINNFWYYFDPQGYIKVSEWFKDGEKWYYLGSDGAMYFSGTTTIDGVEYTFNDDGSLVES